MTVGHARGQVCCHDHQAQQSKSRFSYVKSLVVGGSGSSSTGAREEPELLCDRVLSTATGNWLSHLDWDGHRLPFAQLGLQPCMLHMDAPYGLLMFNGPDGVIEPIEQSRV